jgi:hypothetical protein
MRKLVLSLIAIGTLLSGCVAYEEPYGRGPYYGGDRYYGRDPYYGSRDPYYGDRSRYDSYRYGDRDRDGVPNSRDRYPNDPRYY